jgi:hypothetical protein
MSLAVAGAAGAWGQAPAEQPTIPAAQERSAAQANDASAAVQQGAAQAAQTGAGEAAPAPATAPAEAKTYQVPAGTKVLLALRSAVNTKTAKAGDGVYLASTFPVVVGNRVLIPAGVYVQGVVDRVVRPGRGWGRAELNMHFTTMIFPNGSVVEIPGMVNSLPGSGGQRVKDGEGTIEGQSNAGRVAGDVAKGAEIGAGPGVITGAVEGHPIEGLGLGTAAGAAGGLIYTLFTRGHDVNIESGTAIEMVLQRPLLLEEMNLAGVSGPGYVPAQPQQSQAMEKPKRAKILCPVGGLGCS